MDTMRRMSNSPSPSAPDRLTSSAIDRALLLGAMFLLGAQEFAHARGPAPASAPIEDAGVFRTVNGEPIALADFHRYVGFEHRNDPKFEEEREALVQERLVRREAKRRNLSVTREQLEARYEVLDREARKTNKDGLGAILAAEQIDRSEFVSRLEIALLLERIVREEFDLDDDVPEEKQNIWLQDQRARSTVQVEGIGDDELLRVDGEPISLVDYGKLLVERLAKTSALRRNLEQQYIEVHAVRQYANERGVTLDDAAIDRAIAEREKAVKSKPGMAEYDLATVLAETGSSIAQLKASQRFRTRLLLERLVDLPGEPGADLEAFYSEHRPAFDRLYGEQPIVSTVFLKAGAKGAAKIGFVQRTVDEASRELSDARARIEKGEGTFEDAVKGISQLGNAKDGGLLGAISPADKELGDIATKILDQYRRGEVKVGALIGPLPSATGVHLLKLNGIKPGKKFEELKPEIRKHAMNELLRSIMEKAKVES